MNRIALKLGDKKHDDLLEFARDIAKALRNNPNFSDGDQWADDLEALIDDVTNNDDQLEALLRNTEVLRLNRKTLVKSLKEGLKQTASAVQTASAGNQLMIKSAGMELHSLPSPIGKMPKVRGLLANNLKEGELVLDWNTIKGARSYNIQVKNLSDAAAQYLPAVSTTASSYTFPISIDEEGLGYKAIGIDDEGVRLQRGVAYSFRVAALGAAGQGPWSDPVERIAI